MMSALPRRLTLAIDASAALGTVGVLDGATLLAEDETRMRGESGERLLPTVIRTLKAGGAGLEDLGDIVCGDGPGGFTGLRIAAGVAKGLCVARALPLFAVSSLLLAFAGRQPLPAVGRYLVALDAMRGELFVLDVTLEADGSIAAGSGRRMTIAEARSLAVREHRTTLGVDGDLVVSPHARGVAALRARAPDSIRQVSIDQWEPAYGRKAEAQVKWEAAHGRSLA